MQSSYDPIEIEEQAQSYWEDNLSFRVMEKPEKEKFYCLSMLPYPSGNLHMGHVRNYTIGDVMSRYQRMLGRNVMQPMGWDAFGLPAENAAIQRQVPPAEWTYQNIDHMKGQLKRMGFGYDWSREVTTCRPDYYRWEQWFFSRLVKKGLAYRRNSVVNWDPVDQTVLANEQVIDGRGWRSGAVVEKREIPQWFIRITSYADELLDGLDSMHGWPESVKAMQRNWIGRSEGLEIDFRLAEDIDSPLRVFTTRPDTIYGATFMAVSADHPLSILVAAKDPLIAEFLRSCRNSAISEFEQETAEKRGMSLNVNAINPLSGEKIPVWVANFVLIGYGTGAIMGVPAHDDRDHEFATRYKIPIRQVIAPTTDIFLDVQQEAWTGKEDVVTVNSEHFSGLDFQDAFDQISDFLVDCRMGERKVNYRLRDWGVSRQRYWGCPIPIVYCERCGPVSVPDEQLPVVLPEDVKFMGVQSPLKTLDEWKQTVCPECGSAANRETDTFDTFVESSWYYARYCSPDAMSMLDERANYWLPVDHYIGGIEHAVLHLLYFRFWHKLMRDIGIVESHEPTQKLLCQGMVLSKAYYRDTEGEGRKWIRPEEIEIRVDASSAAEEPIWLVDGKIVETTGWTTMSKSKNNGTDPQKLIDQYGADTVRLFTMFASPPDQALEWNDDAVAGSQRFLRRLWVFVYRFQLLPKAGITDFTSADDETKLLRREVHTLLQKVCRDMERTQYNTVVAACMEMLKILDRFDVDGGAERKAAVSEALSIMIRVLAPFAPHISHSLWNSLGEDTELLDATWPEVDPSALKSDTIRLVVQINGKLRGQIDIVANANDKEIQDAVLSENWISDHVGTGTIKKFIIVPGRLVNVVV
ncbi:MAG: leucine--tRNA ligase [Acidiferrobacteraceae bacterium]|nr:leucine--tRNA ligase [Acidiferrobacteraceae bacterium]